MSIDLNPPKRNPLRRRRRLPALLLIAFLASMSLLTVMLTMGNPSGEVTVANPSTEKTAPPETSIKTIKGSIQTGETMSSLLGEFFTPKELLDLSQQCREIYPLTRISAGRPYKVYLEGEDFKRFTYDIDSDDQLVICREENGFAVSREPLKYQIEQTTVRGTISSSLFQSVIDSGESEALAIQLADIFAWDIDFFHDIRVGDSFEAVVEKRYRNGRPAGTGRLLAANFTVQGETHYAFYFQDGDRAPGYYDRDGRSLRKAFLRAPLDFSRISSGFNMRRRHPITKQVKAHPAIDYAAPAGTPIHSVGNGTVRFAAYRRYNGNCVKIEHPNGWMTMYNHLSRFGKGIKIGTRVKQGELIGYVGSTGLSTGPHLDYRMYKNGKPVNPLKMKSPRARSISRANMAQFKAIVADRVALMEKQASEQNA